MTASEDTVFVLIREAEQFLKNRGFRLVPDSCDWTNDAGDDAGIYAVQHNELDGLVVGWRVEINRWRTIETVPVYGDVELKLRSGKIVAGGFRTHGSNRWVYKARQRGQGVGYEPLTEEPTHWRSFVRTGSPKRCQTNEVGGLGECLYCEADQGEHCRAAKKREISFAGWQEASHVERLQATYNDLLELQDRSDQIPLSQALDAVGLALKVPSRSATTGAKVLIDRLLLEAVRDWIKRDDEWARVGRMVRYIDAAIAAADNAQSDSTR